MHIPDDPQYYEKFYFTPGDLGFRAWDTRFGRIGVLVCWDQWYPEAARLTALSGAQILFYPTAIGWLPAGEGRSTGRSSSPPGRRSSGATPSPTASTSARSTAWATRAIRPAGSSSGAAASSPIRAAGCSCSGGTGEEVLTASCDLAKVDVSRTHWPFLRDRRIDAYEDITRRYLD